MSQISLQTSVFGLALAEATARLADIERRYASLAAEREQLQAAVSSLKKLVSSPHDEETPRISETPRFIGAPRSVTAPEIPIWKRMEEEYLAAGNVPMSVPELARRLEEKGIAAPQKTMRVAIARKTNVFVGSGEYGKYRLRMYPTEETGS